MSDVAVCRAARRLNLFSIRQEKVDREGPTDVCIKREFEPRVTIGTILSDFNLELL